MAASLNDLMYAFFGQTSDLADAQYQFYLAAKNAGITGSNLVAAVSSDKVGGFWPVASAAYTVPSGNTAAVTPSANDESAIPLIVSANATITEVGINCTTGGAGSAFRLGLRADAGLAYPYPGNLIVDWGTVATTSTGWKSVTSLTQAITANTVYWLTATSQGGTPAGVHCINAKYAPFLSTTNSDSVSSATKGYKQTGVSGALPNSFSSTITAAVAVTAIGVKWQ